MTVILLMIYSEIENKSKTLAKIISEIMQVILRSVKKVCSVCNQVIVTRILMMMVWYQINLCKMQTGEMNLIVHSNEIYKMHDYCRRCCLHKKHTASLYGME